MKAAGEGSERGGEEEEDDLLLAVTQHATDPTFVFIPLGCPHEVLPVTSGVRVALTAPLILPEAVLKACAEQVHRDPVPVAAPAAHSVHAEARKQLRKKIAEREKALAALQKEIASLRAEEEALATMQNATPTTLAIASESLRPPFAAMLYNFYPGAPAPQRFTPEDAITYNWILSAFPSCEVRVMNVAYHLPDNGSNHTWRNLIESTETGWIEPDTSLTRAERQTAQRNAHRLRDVRMVYGYSEMPGQVVGHSSIYNDEGHDHYDNFAVTVLHVSEGGGAHGSAT